MPASSGDDVTLNLEAGEADVTTRGNAGWRATVATLKDASIEFEMVWDTAEADFAAIRNAFLNRAAIELAVLDGPVHAPGRDGPTNDMSSCRRSSVS